MGIMTIRNACRGKFTFFLLALVMLGAHQPGFAVTQDIEQLRQAAEQGDADTQFSLGRIYSFGRGAPQAHDEAVKWFRISAEQGAAMAQFKLSHMYANGMGVSQDHNQAVKWLRMAAKQDFAAAQVRLAQLYAKGQGTPEDHVKAYAWLKLATAHADCGRTGRESNRIKDTLREQMTAEQLAEAEQLTAELRERIQASKSQ